MIGDYSPQPTVDDFVDAKASCFNRFQLNPGLLRQDIQSKVLRFYRFLHLSIRSKNWGNPLQLLELYRMEEIPRKGEIFRAQPKSLTQSEGKLHMKLIGVSILACAMTLFLASAVSDAQTGPEKHPLTGAEKIR